MSLSLPIPTAASGLLPNMSATFPAEFRALHGDVASIFGTEPTVRMLLNASEPLFHEAGVFIPGSGCDDGRIPDRLWVTSNFIDDDTVEENKRIQISRVTLPRDGGGGDGPGANEGLSYEEVKVDSVVMANGGINYRNGIVFCSQGNLKTNGGLAFVEPEPPYKSNVLVDRVDGRSFDSPNDVVADPDGSLWFTDPSYGEEQGIRPPANRSQQLFRLDRGLAGSNPRAMFPDALIRRPNGLAFSPDNKTIYVSDTDRVHGDGIDETRPAHIVAYDVVDAGGQPSLRVQRVFPTADVGIPDGIKTDRNGNVYAGCGDGINIWNSSGVLLGKILIDGGAANFCFGRQGKMYILNEKKLWVAQLSKEIRGTILGL